MQLTHLVADLPEAQSAILSALNIRQITSDSRQVTPGALFVAYRGLGADGHRYILDAVRRGAAAVVGEQALTGLDVPYIRVQDGRAALAWLSAAWYGHPSRDMALVGVTGTDGKTTTANLLFNILRAAGRRAGLISTVSAVIGEQTYDTGLHTTTPDAPDVQRYLAEMRAAGTEVVVLETTSHGLAQHRVTGCAFDVAVVTNITHEHLDFHGSYAAYRDAKALLFRSLAASPAKPTLRPLPKTAVLNRDDSSFDCLARIPAERTIAYGIEQGSRGAEGQGGRGAGERGSGGAEDLLAADALHLTAVNVRHHPAGTEFDIHFAPSPHHAITPSLHHIVTPLIGDFNLSNILAAASAAVALGVEPAAIAAGVAATSGVPGRMERIDAGQPFTAIVDFAHTPNALARALEAVRALTGPAGRLIVVFGSAGLRDREKRWLMGEVAARWADVSVITAEDPRTEDLAAILAETAAALVARGRTERRDFYRIPDRQTAILFAVRQARPGDVVIICGKGHEQSMCFGAIEHPWRDQDALRWALEMLAGRAAEQPPFRLPTWEP